MLFTATRPSGSNRQPFRFMGLPTASDRNTSSNSSPKAPNRYGMRSDLMTDTTRFRHRRRFTKARMARTTTYVDHFADAVLVLACPSATANRRQPKAHRCTRHVKTCCSPLEHSATEGLTGFQGFIEEQLRSYLEIPESCTRRSHHPQGSSRSHGPVQRRPCRRLPGRGVHYGLTIPQELPYYRTARTCVTGQTKNRR